MLASSHSSEMESKVGAVLLLIAIVAFCDRSVASGSIGESCVIDNCQGKCKLPQDCESFDLESPEEHLKFISNRCGFLPGGKKMIICCPETTVEPPRIGNKNDLPASQVACNQLEARKRKRPRKLDDYIIRGVNASDSDFPQFAALAHQPDAKTKPQFICGGVLISENFVLTAAHCITAETPVTFVRLGTIHLSNKDWSTDVNVKVSESLYQSF